MRFFSTKAKKPHTYQVVLAASELGPYVPGLGQAFHTSVLVDNVEYEFSGQGICLSRGPASHERFTRGHELIELGGTVRSPKEMMAMLTAYFRPGTYDLLRKNCNSFTSCALHFLLGAMLDPKYSSMESCAVTVSSYIDLVSLIMPNYQPNPNAEGFCVEHVRRDINYHEQKAAQGAKAKAPSRAWILVVGLRRRRANGAIDLPQDCAAQPQAEGEGWRPAAQYEHWY
ncbi:unnamed protein product [Effrenium voratum]|uniref:PPPDE domain-containing protein n=1 Tax=Effrenium voratum TaxID=2562239 RepID=A0AA36JJI6_9DINO|nr:unnamed protein product [Effrenium voratum]